MYFVLFPFEKLIASKAKNTEKINSYKLKMFNSANANWLTVGNKTFEFTTIMFN